MKKIIDEIDLLLRMRIPTETYTSYGAQPNTDEDFDITVTKYMSQAVTNRMNDLRKQWELLKPMIVDGEQ